MKKALLRLSLLFLALLCGFYSHGQSQVFWLTITDSTAIDHIDTIGTSYIPTFTDPGVQGTFGGGGGNVSIEQAMPMADFLCLRQIWRVKGADSAFMNTLVSSYPALFPSYILMPQFEPLGYTPNDWDLLGQGGVDYLDFIGAREAWYYDPILSPYGTQGDSTVIIGIVDEFFDTTNADIRENSAAIRITGDGSGSHGTEVAGVAAGRTDNHHMLPSMGFRCKMNLSDDSDWYSELQHISKDTTGGRVRVTNGSWGHSEGPGPLKINGYQQPVFDELYENGITAVFAAGNGWLNRGPSQLSYTYEYPASYDFNISVSSIGHRFTSGSSELQDIHEFYSAGDSVHTFQHNDRVDICAPGWGILLQTNGDTSHSFAGTSFSSPTVAGVCALMYSQQSCLTPYQVEYLLKKHSKDIYQQSWDGIHFYNAHYYDGVSRYSSRLGAGRVQADQAVFAAHPKNFECNDPTTQTMTIDGVSLSHNCVPYTVSGMAFPQLKIGEIHNGRPPYRYLWTPLEGNNMILSSYTSASPQITGMSMRAILDGETPLARFRLAVYDASEIQKVATVRFKAVLINDPGASDLAMRDSYFDMLDEPNSQYIVNTKNYDIWHSPDIWNRDTLDGGMTHQNPEHFTTDSPNYIYVRVRNVGCATVEQDRAKLKLYWTLSSTGEHWKYDWDGSTLVLGDSAGKWVPAGGMITDTVQIPQLSPAIHLS
jgi:subtilisin family serine protease